MLNRDFLAEVLLRDFRGDFYTGYSLIRKDDVINIFIF